MPAGNKKGGKKHKKGKKNVIENTVLHLKDENDNQEYAQIKACKGNCRFDLICFDGKERMGILCGKMRKRTFVNNRDVVLVSLRDFQDDKCDIIYKYNDSQVLQLKSKKKIPNFIKLEEENEFFDESIPFDFTPDMPDEEEGEGGKGEKDWWNTDKSSEPIREEEIIDFEEI